jgi:hypothetical protein
MGCFWSVGIIGGWVVNGFNLVKFPDEAGQSI